MKKMAFGFLVVFLLISGNTLALAKQDLFHIGPGDTIEISVWKDESLIRKLVVPPDGIISFPLIEDIYVLNMTVADLRKAITRKLSEYIPDATVTVMLIQIESLRAYVIGKVNKPGQYPIGLDTTVMQILSMAGGMNPFASASKIKILRRQNKKTVQIPFNYKEVEKGQSLQQNIVLQRGDVVVVP